MAFADLVLDLSHSVVGLKEKNQTNFSLFIWQPWACRAGLSVAYRGRRSCPGLPRMRIRRRLFSRLVESILIMFWGRKEEEREEVTQAKQSTREREKEREREREGEGEGEGEREREGGRERERERERCVQSWQNSGNTRLFPTLSSSFARLGQEHGVCAELYLYSDCTSRTFAHAFVHCRSLLNKVNVQLHHKGT
jgi:hypothetical protein